MFYIIIILFFLVMIMGLNFSVSKRFFQSIVNRNPIVSPTIAPVAIVSVSDQTLEEEPAVGSASSAAVTKDYGDFKYPNSNVVAENNEELFLKSTDDPELITNWYKALIKNFSMNIRNFLQTKTNGNVLNRLSAENKRREIDVDIAKQSNSREVEIRIRVKDLSE